MPYTEEINILLEKGKKAFFLSDFHLGTHIYAESRSRENRIVEWLDKHAMETGVLFLLGDIFDYWFEYRYVVPKGHVRLLGCLARMADSGIDIHFFCGNHDLWMRDYFEKELGIHVHTGNALVRIDQCCFMVGHGDGINPDEKAYRIMKSIFGAKACKILYACLHPYWASTLARALSRHSRKKGLRDGHREREKKKNIALVQYLEKVSASLPEIDAFILAHRHWPIIYNLGTHQTMVPPSIHIHPQEEETEKKHLYYINTGDWIHYDSYVEFHQGTISLKGKEIKNTL